MRPLLILFICLLVIESCAFREKSDVPQIDQSKITVDNLIWDLDQLQQVPDFEYLDSTSKVREILFNGPDHEGKETSV